jgi:hypothetical protein
LTAAVVILGASATASAGLIASDSYATGSNPLAGQYTAGNSLSNYNGNTGQPINLTNTGFANGGYNSGIGTGNFMASSTGLVSAADGSDSSTGSVEWTGAPLDNQNRSVARTLSPFTEGSSGTYWTSMLVSNAGTQTTTNGFVLAGFGGSSGLFPGAPGASVGGNIQGIYIGFADENGGSGEADLIIRSRDTSTSDKGTQDTTLVSNSLAGQTYLVVAEMNVNPGGSSLDSVTYWVDPTDFTSTTSLTSTAIASATFSTYSFAGSTTTNGNDFYRLNYAENDWDGQAYFDQVELGTSLASITPLTNAVPEPASIAMTALGLGGFAMASYLRRRRSAR